MSNEERIKAMEAQMADMAKRLMPEAVTCEMVDRAQVAHSQARWRGATADEQWRETLEAALGIERVTRR